jgi:TP901-1 family phage major tail protein
MAVATEAQVLQGLDTLAYIRLLKNAAKERGQLIPYQTSLDFDPQRDSDSTATKSGNVATTSSLETDLEVEFINNISKVSDDMYDSLIKNEKIEVWIVYRKRRNEKGQYFAWYMRGTVTEDESDNDPDDNSTRDATFTIDGTPQRGWLTLPDEAEEELAYVFRGLGAIDGEPKNDGTDGEGQEWSDKDRGQGSGDDPASNTTA